MVRSLENLPAVLALVGLLRADPPLGQDIPHRARDRFETLACPGRRDVTDAVEEQVALVEPSAVPENWMGPQPYGARRSAVAGARRARFAGRRTPSWGSVDCTPHPFAIAFPRLRQSEHDYSFTAVSMRGRDHSQFPS